MCEVRNFGAITASLCERLQLVPGSHPKLILGFRLIWSCSCCKALQIFNIIPYIQNP